MRRVTMAMRVTYRDQTGRLRTAVHTHALTTAVRYVLRRQRCSRSTNERDIDKSTLSTTSEVRLVLDYQRTMWPIARRARTGATGSIRARGSHATAFSLGPTTLPGTRIRYTMRANKRCDATSARRKRLSAEQMLSRDTTACVTRKSRSLASIVNAQAPWEPKKFGRRTPRVTRGLTWAAKEPEHHARGVSFFIFAYPQRSDIRKLHSISCDETSSCHAMPRHVVLSGRVSMLVEYSKWDAGDARATLIQLGIP